MPYAALDNMRLTARRRRSPNSWTVGDLLDYSLDRRGKFVGTLRLVDVSGRELIGEVESGGARGPILIRRSAIAGTA